MLLDRDIALIVDKVAEGLIQRHDSLVTVESCTGGGIAYVLTSKAGSSEWFDRAFVTYSNEAKQEMVDVNSETLNKFGAVSEEIAREMVLGALNRCDASYALSVTGVAGPGGGSDHKPVGMVCFGWGKKVTGNVPVTETQTRYFDGDRESVRKQTILHSLRFFASYLSEKSP